jgi:hypothetical protein
MDCKGIKRAATADEQIGQICKKKVDKGDIDSPMIDPRKWLVRSIQLPLRSPCAIPVDAFSVGISTKQVHTAFGSLYHLSVTDQHPQCELRFGDI